MAALVTASAIEGQFHDYVQALQYVIQQINGGFAKDHICICIDLYININRAPGHYVIENPLIKYKGFKGRSQPLPHTG